MSDGKIRPDSEKSRQELLDEVYYLRDVAGEREQQILRLRGGGTEDGARAVAELDRILRSRSWRLTAPLRWLGRLLGRPRGIDAAVVAPITATHASFPAAPESPARANAQTQAPARPVTVEVRGDSERRLYVDVTELALHQGKTGVQRVTREILCALLASPPLGFVVLPVGAPPGEPYQSTRLFNEGETAAAVGFHGRIAPRAGDVFLGLDHSIRAVVERASELDAMRGNGVAIWFVCNDVLPLDHPEWFPEEVPPKFEAWLRVVLTVADGVACISKATESALRARMDAMRVVRERPIVTGHFGLGADMARSADAGQVTSEEAAQVERLQGRTSFLMVGTLEPRKGHAQALEAFHRLWASGEDVVLVVAGLPGWRTEVLQRRIRHHDEFGRRLFWFDGASDALLEKLYSSCSALLAPSEGEGFGLPLVEAARFGLPILCRDLAVFKEVAGPHASYFHGRDPEALVHAIRGWIDARRQGAVPDSRAIKPLSWSDAARQLTAVVLAGAVADAGARPPLG